MKIEDYTKISHKRYSNNNTDNKKIKYLKSLISRILMSIILVISISIKTREKSLFVQAMSCLFESIYDFLIYAYTGAVLSFLNFIRTCLFINKNKFSKYVYFSFLIIFEMIILLNSKVCTLFRRGLYPVSPTLSLLKKFSTFYLKRNYDILFF